MLVIPGYQWDGDRLVSLASVKVKQVVYNGQRVKICATRLPRKCGMCGSDIAVGDRYGVARKAAYCIPCLTPVLENEEEEKEEE